MPKKPLTNIEIQKRLDALERKGMFPGGTVGDILPAGFDYTQIPGYVPPAINVNAPIPVFIAPASGLC